MKKTVNQQSIVVRAQGTYSTFSRFSRPICGGIGPVSLLLCRSLENQTNKNHSQFKRLKNSKGLKNSQASPYCKGYDDLVDK